MTTFLAWSIVATLVAIACIAVPLMRRKEGHAPIAALVTALFLPVAVVLGYVTVSDYPWSSPRDVNGWASMGDAYLAQGHVAQARDAYRQAMNLGDADDDMIMAYVEAAVLTDSSALQGEPGNLIDEVLKRNSRHAKALWYGGIRSLGLGDVETAKSRWRQLLDLSPPPEVRKLLEQQLAALDAPTATDSSANIQAGEGAVSVRVRIAPELAGKVTPGATLFLIARAPGASGPPLAVVRRSPAELPLELVISDADRMAPGESLATLAAIQLTARLTNSGDAKAAIGDVYGETTWRSGPPSGQPTEILIDKVIQ